MKIVVKIAREEFGTDLYSLLLLYAAIHKLCNVCTGSCASSSSTAVVVGVVVPIVLIIVLVLVVILVKSKLFSHVTILQSDLNGEHALFKNSCERNQSRISASQIPSVYTCTSITL